MQDIPKPLDTFSLACFLGVRHKNFHYAVVSKNKLYKVHRIPKKDGTFRILHEPLGIMRVLHNNILEQFVAPVKLGACVGAYAPGCGVKYSTTSHTNKNVIIEMDIKEFFDNTSSSKVRQFFQKQGQLSVVARALANVLTVPTKNGRPGLPQGSPISPAISNAIAYELIDQPILTELANSNWAYTRYSDNLIFSSNTTDSAEVGRIITLTTRIITMVGYRVKSAKTKVMWQRSPHRPQRVLGLHVNVSQNIPRLTYQRLRAVIHTAEKQGWDAVYGLPETCGSSALEKFNHLHGTVSYYLHMNQNSPKLNKLIRKLNAIKPSTAATSVTVNSDQTNYTEVNRKETSQEGSNQEGFGQEFKEDSKEADISN